MRTTTYLSQTNLRGLAEDLLTAGTRVVAPAKIGRAPYQQVDYQRIAKVEELAMDGALPSRPLKQFFMPPTEILLRWKQKKSDVEIEEISTQFPATVILGARPCDAAAPGIVDCVMNWDYRDELYFGRRDATTIIGLACGGFDKSCFCTAVGLGPDATAGSDLFLTPVDGGYHVDVLTEKGESLVQAHAARFSDSTGMDAAKRFHADARKKVESNLNPVPPAVRQWLESNFEHTLLESIALRCHGCGACASVCPTCHCFDIVDEARGVDRGERRRNWDTCQTSRFTVHGSGHNPRANQNTRFRQRVTHKFAIYPKKFEKILCSGCGRCARACPGGMDLPELLAEIERLATSAEAPQLRGERS